MREVALVLFTATWQRQRCLSLVADLTLLGITLCNAPGRGDEKEGAGQSGRHGDETGYARDVRAKEDAKGK